MLQVQLKKALEIINDIKSQAKGSYYLRCNCITDNGIKYLYTYDEYRCEDNSRTAEDFITKVNNYGSFFLTIYYETGRDKKCYCLVDEHGNAI